MSGWRALEFFAGIGGFAAAVNGQFPISAAYDINEHAGKWYRSQYPHPYRHQSIDGLKVKEIIEHKANMWWLSPPCQPFTQKGKRLDLDDNRNKGFLNLLKLFAQVGPKIIAMENVPGFIGSHSHRLFQSEIEQKGYSLTELCLCPSELGIPNQRRRYYAIAAATPISVTWDKGPSRRVGDFIQSHFHSDPQLQIKPDLLDRFQQGMHICDSDSQITRCFTAGYGRNWVKSGSYLRYPQGIRLFHPLEVAALLGHSLNQIPAELSYRQAWKLLGNGLSGFAMRVIVRGLISADTE